MTTATGSARRLPLLGNEAVGRGLVEAGCHLVLAYPGTPSSEVLPAATRFAAEEGAHVYTEWCANEKVALEQALAASYTGKRTAVVMKQVGLNVAADPLMSAAYIGVLGGLLIVVADDPGPSSSQTEQDTRQFAHFAKVPVLDPATPSEARAMCAYGLELSERHETPVILRISQRVCHGREDIELAPVQILERPARFRRDPLRWAATPRQRYVQHVALNKRLKVIAGEFDAERRFNVELHGDVESSLGIIAGGVPCAVLLDLLDAHGVRVPVLRIGTPHPLPRTLVEGFASRFEQVLILEEPDQVLELLVDDRRAVRGRRDGTVPDAGELDAAVLSEVLHPLLLEAGLVAEPWPRTDAADALTASLDLPGRPPTLCAGCPHRASFFAIRAVGGKRGIFPSDIGCYTLGIQQGAVDTVHDMGAAVSMAAGFYRAHAHDGGRIPPILATIGDSTFFHGGLPPLANAVYADARFTLVILDNRVTAMTGMQPPLASGVLADGKAGNTLSIEDTCTGLGVRWVEVVDPFDVAAMTDLLKRAVAFNREPDGGVAVLVARRPCVIHDRASVDVVPVTVDDERCNRCDLCLDRFGCPALEAGAGSVHIDPTLCIDCGICADSCARGAIVELQP